MKPYVIDRSKLNFFVILAFTLIILSFFLGYYLARYQAGIGIFETGSGQQTSPDIESSKDVTSDKAGETETGKDGESDQSAEPERSEPIKSSLSQEVSSVAQISARPAASARTSTAGSQAATGTIDDPSTLETTEKLKYSIQAGMFGSQANATRFLNQLKSAGFKAYMERHQGTDGVVRYNVRFGQFASRPDAEQRLQEYKQGFTTPAYVIINP